MTSPQPIFPASVGALRERTSLPSAPGNMTTEVENGWAITVYLGHARDTRPLPHDSTITNRRVPIFFRSINHQEKFI
jgi:hypothetical protein